MLLDLIIVENSNKKLKSKNIIKILGHLLGFYWYSALKEVIHSLNCNIDLLGISISTYYIV